MDIDDRLRFLLHSCSRREAQSKRLHYEIRELRDSIRDLREQDSTRAERSKALNEELMAQLGATMASLSRIADGKREQG